MRSPAWLAVTFLSSLVMPAFVCAQQPGELDSTFGVAGRVFTEIAVPTFDFYYPNAESILVQPDGRILVCGRFWEDVVSYWYGTFIVRYLPDGTLDSSFGDNGKVALIPPGQPYGSKAVGADMALQPDFAEALFWKVQEVVKAFYLVQLDAVVEFVEWVEVGDDLGSQRSPH